MNLKQTRADCKQYQESDFCLRKSKCTCIKSSTNLKLDSIILGDITSSFTNTKIYLNDDFSPNDYQSSINDKSYNDSSSDNQDTDKESIRREYDSNKKHNHYTGNTRSYFPNLTKFLIFLWITKHQIGFEAYKDFANIIKMFHICL
ncbi:16534_t:CDS:2 [Funneliformis caledonium]|uniref:16534_t:CDS:1 n=1 Tax=Funneliformis caledonium TaxID=1117310 RepID=A0A9N9N5Y2_9GLOM|nr:16534_t:CDS:2 [Funneliformis caledonium]